MKKHSFSVILLAASLLSTGFVTSCKDNDSDLFNDLDRELAEQATLSSAIQSQISDLEAKIKVLEAKQECTCQVTDAWKEVLKSGSFDQSFADTWARYYSSLYATQTQVTEALNAAKDAKTYAEELSGKVDATAAEIVTLSQKVNDMNTLIENAQKTADEAKSIAEDALSKANAAQITADSALSLAQQNQSTLASLSEDLTSVKNQVSVIDGTLKLVSDTASMAYAKAIELESKYDALAPRVDEAQHLISVYGAEISTLGERVTTLEELLNAGTVGKDYTYQIDSLGHAIDSVGNQIESVKYYIDSLGNVTTELTANLKLSIDSVRNEAAQNLETAKAYAVQAVSDTAAVLRVEMDTKVGSLKSELLPLITANSDSITALRTSIAENTDKINTLSESVSSLKTTVDNLKADLSSLITNIIIQGTADPVFGYMALPLGIQTNILAAYYGSALSSNLTFPSTRAANYVDESAAFTSEDKDAIGGFNTQKFEAGVSLTGDAGNAGTIYLTINPTNIDFTDQKFTLVLVNSQDDESPIKIEVSSIKKSDALLTFGYTRANNGFYEAKATLLPENAQDAKPNINLSEFKSIASDVLNSKTLNITDVVSTLYNQINGFLPRYAAKTYWTNSDGEEVAVLSSYCLATTAIKPLSYNFAKDLNIPGINRRLPLIDEDLISSKLNDVVGDVSISFNIDSVHITVPDLQISISWDSIQFDTTGMQLTVNYEYEIPKYQYNETTKQVEETGEYEKKTGTATVSDVDKLYNEIETEVNKHMESMVDSITGFNSKISDFKIQIENLENDINNMISSINGQLDTQIKDVIEDIKKSFNSFGSNYISRYNSVATRLNSVLNRISSFIKNANSKLQPMMLYKTVSGDNAQLSAAKAWPTTFTATGSATQGVELVASSYTAELLAPAFKKYVVVTNVFNGSASAQDGDAKCQAALKAANENSYNFNEVVEGSNRSFVFVPNTEYTGYIYEIAYAGLDYSGKVALRRFYVRVK